MNPTIKKQWVEALRSGEYKQGREYLRQGDKFCCLGVLCDLYGKQHGVEWQDKFFLSQPTTLPTEVRDWAGLPNHNPEVVDISDEKISLVILNDGDDAFCGEDMELSEIKPHTFLEIADIIEAQL